jgi:DNA-binding transcriptional ArsR family regulator
VQRLLLNAEDLAKLRVSTSWPFSEVLLSLRLLRGRRSSPLVGTWREQVRSGLPPETALLLALVPPSTMVDLHTVAGAAASMEEALDALRRAPLWQLRSELDHLHPLIDDAAPWLHRWLRDLTDGAPRARRELARRFHEYHQRAVEPYWDRVQSHLEAERLHRARVMADGGVDQLLATLHPRVRWRPPVLDVENASDQRNGAAGQVAGCTPPPSTVLDGRSLVLVPVVFDLDGPHVLYDVADDSQPLLFLYPALREPVDAMALWTPPSALGHQALAMLLGRTRASALETIAGTSTTTELARRLGVSAATASHHVGVLRSAGLIASQRTGNSVLHHVTTKGALLLDAPHPAHAPTVGP